MNVHFNAHPWSAGSYPDTRTQMHALTHRTTQAQTRRDCNDGLVSKYDCIEVLIINRIGNHVLQPQWQKSSRLIHMGIAQSKYFMFT